MSFALPAATETDIATMLRALEQDNDRGPGQRRLPDNVRAALLAGAVEIEGWRTLAQDAQRELEALVNERISAMASESAQIDQQRQSRSTLASLVERIKTRLGQ